MLDGNVVSWTSKKQQSVSLSSTESEYVAASIGCQEAIWIKTWLIEVLAVEPTITVSANSQAAKAIANQTGMNERLKHIDLRFHLIKRLVTTNQVTLTWVSTGEQLADIMTKLLGNQKMLLLRDRLLAK